MAHLCSTRCSGSLLSVLDGPSASASPSGSRRLFSNALASGGVIVVVVRRLTHSLMVRTRSLLPWRDSMGRATALRAHPSMSASLSPPVVADVPVGRTLPILGLPVPSQTCARWWSHWRMTVCFQWRRFHARQSASWFERHFWNGSGGSHPASRRQNPPAPACPSRSSRATCAAATACSPRPPVERQLPFPSTTTKIP